MIAKSITDGNQRIISSENEEMLDFFTKKATQEGYVHTKRIEVDKETGRIIKVILEKI